MNPFRCSNTNCFDKLHCKQSDLLGIRASKVRSSCVQDILFLGVNPAEGICIHLEDH